MITILKYILKKFCEQLGRPVQEANKGRAHIPSVVDSNTVTPLS